MATREAFIQELEGLNQELNAMSQMVQDAIDSSFQALTEHNEELAQKVIKGDRDVDNMERKIETHCLTLMLKQQPVASDLRHISTALKVVTDLERMGDQGAIDGKKQEIDAHDRMTKTDFSENLKRK